MKKLVKRAQGGDADAFVQLMEENRQSMYKVAVCYVNNPEDAADIMQDTMLAAFEKIQDLKEPGYFRTWLTRILINKCKDFLDKRSWEVAFDEIPEKACSDTSLDHLMYEELIQAVDEQYREDGWGYCPVCEKIYDMAGEACACPVCGWNPGGGRR